MRRFKLSVEVLKPRVQETFPFKYWVQNSALSEKRVLLSLETDHLAEFVVFLCFFFTSTCSMWYCWHASPVFGYNFNKYWNFWQRDNFLCAYYCNNIIDRLQHVYNLFDNFPFPRLKAEFDSKVPTCALRHLSLLKSFQHEFHRVGHSCFNFSRERPICCCISCSFNKPAEFFFLILHYCFYFCDY